MEDPYLASAPVTTAVATYIADADQRPISTEVTERVKQHVLDALIAVCSGATLRPGRLAISYAVSRAAPGPSTIVGSSVRTQPELAAFANAMCAHADETDDVNNVARIHPGASIVPAAIATAEAYDRSGADLIAGVRLGYNLGCGINIGAWSSLLLMRQSVRSSHGLGQAFGAAGAAAFLAGLSVSENRFMLSYTAQLASGLRSFYRDLHHIGKAFASAAMQAQHGVQAVEMVKAGFTDLVDILDGDPGLYDAFGQEPDSQRLLNELAHGEHVMTTDLKQFPVGFPIQAPAHAMARIIARRPLAPSDVEAITVRMPTYSVRTVDDRFMPDINVQYALSVMIADGRLTFASAHDYERHRSPDIKRLMDRIELVIDPSWDPTPDEDPIERRTRLATVTVNLADGSQISEHVSAPRGTRHNPMNWDELRTKAHMALVDVMPPTAVDELVDTVAVVERLGSVRELRPWLDRAGTSA